MSPSLISEGNRIIEKKISSYVVMFHMLPQVETHLAGENLLYRSMIYSESAYKK